MHLHAIICQVLYYVFCGILQIIVSQKISVHAFSNLDKETKRNPWPFMGARSELYPLQITRTLNISPSIIKPLVLFVKPLSQTHVCHLQQHLRISWSPSEMFRACQQNLMTAQCSNMSIDVNVFDSIFKRGSSQY